MTEIKFNRFKDAPWFIHDSVDSSFRACIVGGAGGISSWLIVFLTRAGFKPVVYDFDTVEPHNLGGQLYVNTSVGKTKVEAIHELTVALCNESIVTLNEKYDSDSMTGKFVFAGFDNMKARADMYHNWKDYAQNLCGMPEECIFIDGRLLAEQLQIFCIRGNDTVAMEKYEKEHLFSDSEVEEAACTFRQTSHVAAMIAATMTGFFTNHVANIMTKNNHRSVPFYHEYFVPLNLSTDEY